MGAVKNCRGAATRVRRDRRMAPFHVALIARRRDTRCLSAEDSEKNPCDRGELPTVELDKYPTEMPSTFLCACGGSWCCDAAWIRPLEAKSGDRWRSSFHVKQPRGWS